MADNKSNNADTPKMGRKGGLSFIRSRIKHGLFLLTARNALMRLGVDIDPLWIELESPEFCTEPQIRDDASKYSCRIIDDSVLKENFKYLGWSSELLDKIIDSNHIPLGLYCNEELAAFMIATLERYDTKGKIVPLEHSEAYLEYMFTFENFRGKSLAPYLRYKSYLILRDKGITKLYSGTQYFNKSSLKFKKKLGAKHLEFWLHIVLFKKLRWHVLLKKYDVNV